MSGSTPSWALTSPGSRGGRYPTRVATTGDPVEGEGRVLRREVPPGAESLTRRRCMSLSSGIRLDRSDLFRSGVMAFGQSGASRAVGRSAVELLCGAGSRCVVAPAQRRLAAPEPPGEQLSIAPGSWVREAMCRVDNWSPAQCVEAPTRRESRGPSNAGRWRSCPKYTDSRYGGHEKCSSPRTCGQNSGCPHPRPKLLIFRKNIIV